MVIFPNAKINIGLQVLDKRADGYHNLNTIFYPVPVYDALEIIEKKNQPTPFTLKTYGTGPDIEPAQNFCYKAYFLLKKDFPSLPPIQTALVKLIPTGGGLGGGSSDGAYMLTLLNKKFALNISKEKLKQYALSLGSDCPFFIDSLHPVIANGRGEQLTPLELSLNNFSILLVNPSIPISTKWAFENLHEFSQKSDLASLVKKHPKEWKGLIINDFEKPIFSAFSEIAAIAKILNNAGACYVSLSGTGSSLFAIFEKPLQPLFNFPEHYFVKWV